jgi:hypothetical protein
MDCQSKPATFRVAGKALRNRLRLLTSRLAFARRRNRRVVVFMPMPQTTPTSCVWTFVAVQ